MNIDNLFNQVLKILNANYKDIFAIDLMEDKTYILGFDEAGKMHVDKEISYSSDFINTCYQTINKEDISAYFDSISPNKLENESINGNFETKFKYRKILQTGEERWYLNIINYVQIDNKKIIIVISEDINDRLLDTEKKTNELESTIDDYKNKLETEAANMADALYQVNNILDNSSNGGILQTKDTRSYINSVFSSASLQNPELNKALTSKLNESANYKKPSILICDDSSIIRNSLKRIFEVDYNILMVKSGNEAIKFITDHYLNANISGEYENIVGILLDLVMPDGDGFTVLNFFKNYNLFSRIPVAIISGDETLETRKKVYEYEIVDMLEKPFNTDTIRRRLGKIINLYMTSSNLQNIIVAQNAKIDDEVNKDTNKDDNLKVVVTKIISNVLNNNESIKLKKMASILCNYIKINFPLYNLNDEKINYIIKDIPYYNIGSIAMGDNEILSNTTIQQEIEYGITIMNACIFDDKEKEVASNIIKYSFEYYDGSGYPNKLVGDNIPIEAQISNLLIKILKNNKTKSLLTAIKLVIDKEGSKFNPNLIKALSDTKREFKNI